MALQILGTEEISKDNFTFFPNPVSSEITISISPNEIPEKVEVYAISGKLVEVFLNSTVINITNLDSGTYILRCELRRITRAKIN
jgi:hypothetical protein